MKIEQEFVAEFFRVLRHRQRVLQIVRQILADRLNKNAEADPVIAVIFENLQTRQCICAVLENHSAILGLFQKRQVRAEGEIRRARPVCRREKQ